MQQKSEKIQFFSEMTIWAGFRAHLGLNQRVSGHWGLIWVAFWFAYHNLAVGFCRKSNQ